MKIKDSVIAITGANRGIGRAVALALAAREAHLILLNRTIDAGLTEELLKVGAKSVKQEASDLSSRQGVQAALDYLAPLKIDILFNNAGLLTGGLIEDQPLDEIYAMLQVNVNALIHMTRGVIPGMLARGHGKIINHASVSSILHIPCASTYSASKAAVLAFTRCVSAELRGSGVSTLALITPGVKTRMYDQIEVKYSKNLNLSALDSMPVEKYAERICWAIEKDLDELKPTGSSRWTLRMAQHWPELFERIVRTQFKR